MHFRVCPMDARVEKLFARPTERLLNKRTRLGARAYIVRTTSNLEACKNPIQQFRLDGFSDRELAAMVIKHLAPTMEKKNVCFWFGYYDKSPLVIMKASEIWVRFNQDPYDKDMESGELFSLEFQVRSNPSHLRMNGLRSAHSGQAGKALAALYNLAEELKLPRIEYSVLGSNRSAMQFYFHLDFGYPKDLECTDWVVEVEK